MRSTPPVSAVVFAVIGALLLVAALVLGILGSFAFIAIASVGMFFIAAALIAELCRRRLGSARRRGDLGARQSSGREHAAFAMRQAFVYGFVLGILSALGFLTFGTPGCSS